ncbi:MULTISPECIES: hypothetical protein [Moorena]|uniref:hypothetical protein n=1 Tax=Moorena TaxID=1155738 RepID=UPI0012B56C66|nr:MULTISPECIES: hypothetical protein [Moorena]NEP66768.1 hypothetical protein [Moorena sp. SIO3A5]NEQ08742.1 hypothetical protein [Moorena sp. SIO4E2]NER87161.1 hypothetical protein [Moorena sp. SIO3A2]NES40656.1 hypothetical protein [Moorena sp. SIO2C4]NET67273.1 hypothetical protein [Moorena sp. SIO1G6]
MAKRPRDRVQPLTRLTRLNLQPSTFNLQPSTFNLQPANLQQTVLKLAYWHN